jgi:uncharacterized phage-like protein YoqJ
MNNLVRRHTKPAYKRCAFTGYRPQKLPFGFNESHPACVALKVALYHRIEDLIGQGYAHFLSGGAMATDTWAAEAVLELKAKYPWVILEMVSPFDGQADRWSEEYRARHDRLFAAADIVTVISHSYTKSCMFRRNRYLVDNADLLLAVYDGQPGGTAMTCAYAREIGVRVLCLTPGMAQAG